MVDVSSLADCPNKFGSFQTVVGKFRYNATYIFRIIFPEKSIWKLIISQAIINFFLASVPILTVLEILQANCICKMTKYFPLSFLWINRLFAELANKNGRICLTIDSTGVNPSSLGRLRTEATIQLNKFVIPLSKITRRCLMFL